MLHRKLLEILTRLTPEQHKSLRLFLQSPYFNQGSNSAMIMNLYDYISARGHDENHPEFSKALVHGQFFPDRVFREKEKSPLDSLASDLFRLVRKFFAQKDFEQEQNNAIESLPLMRFYRRNNLEERFWQTVETVRKIQKNNFIRGSQYFLDQFRIEEEISNFQGVYNTHEDDANLSTVHGYLDKFFSIIKLEIICASNHRERLSQIKFITSPILSYAVLEASKSDDYADIPLVLIYRKILILIESPSDELNLADLKSLLNKYKPVIPTDKFRDLQAYYRAFRVWQYANSGNPSFRQKIFEVTNEHLAQGYFYIDHKITPMALRVLTNSGL